MHQIIVVAIPIFALCIGVEFAYGLLRRRNTYGLADTVSSLSQGLISQAVAVCTQLFQIGLYVLALPHLSLFKDNGWWDTPAGWVLAVVLYDLCDYWLHRASHESAIFWAAHVVHHQSEHFNLSTALRQETAYAFLGWMFFMPMALVGVPVEQFGIAGLIVLVYQFWIHTEHIGKLGWIDRVFSTPSNHRVHHAINDQYIDKNYGAILVVWDRLFGTFTPEGERCVYGTRTPFRSWNPIAAVTREYLSLARQVQGAARWGDKWRYVFKAPGWRPPDAPAKAPAAAVPEVGPTLDMSGQVAAGSSFVAVLFACCWFLWRADDMSYAADLVSATGVVFALWIVGLMLGRRLRPLAGLLLCGLGVAATVILTNPLI